MEYYKTLDWQRFSEILGNLSLGDKSSGKSQILIFDDLSFSFKHESKMTLLDMIFDFFKCKRNPSKRKNILSRDAILKMIHYQRGITKLIKSDPQ